MSVLVVGLSHRSAPIDLLERLALGPEGTGRLAGQVHGGEHVEETLVLATCNRLEVVVEAGTFHGALAEVGEALCELSGLSREDLTPHLYVHYDERAAAHLFSVATGLDSMAVGESQILGQLREAFTDARRRDHLGPALNPLLQRALRVGKRAHAETTIDEVSRSLVTLALDRAAGVLGDLTSARTVVVGAGAMSGLAVATLARAGIEDVVVVNRTRERAERLAQLHDVRSDSFDRLATLVGSADLVITCTGASGHVIDAETLARARCGAGRSSAPQVLLDLALPRDVAPDVTRLTGVRLWGLAELQTDGARLDLASESALGDVEQLVAGEVADYLVERRTTRLGPTLAALRASAARVVDGEMTRLDQRLPELAADDRAEVRRTVQRVVDKLLHTPTVRVKQLQAAGEPGDYAHALRALFDLDPHEVVVETSPALDVPREVTEAMSASAPAPGTDRAARQPGAAHQQAGAQPPGAPRAAGGAQA